MKKWFLNILIPVGIIIVLFIITIWGCYSVISLKNNPNLSNAYVALGTLLLALATGFLAFFTWLSIKSGDEREKRRRKEELAREKRDKKERLLNEVIEWVSDVKRKTLQGDIPYVILERKQRYEVIFLALSDVLLKAELMKLRTSENSMPVVDELDNVWQSAFFCSQLAARIMGNQPTDQQRKSWSNKALDIVIRIDQLEAQGKLTDQEMYHGQKILLENISTCLERLVKFEATM